MNTRINAGGEIGGVAAGVNQVPTQAPAARIEMPANPSGLTSGEAEQHGVPRKNPHASTMANRSRDFTRMNPPIYTGSRIVEDPL
ncbi:hypothetical protein EJD97_001688 [Solanum chilense]|uniref:Uncharacterized protein n=1 Tax=Solanum chilense TaxID=4083 RepID=A0A6N2BXG5_SOLCI|nr:hypothetical protein EJD97_001688 [Solanum chilense]